jgi:hypothetical protein
VPGLKPVGLPPFFARLQPGASTVVPVILGALSPVWEHHHLLRLQLHRLFSDCAKCGSFLIASTGDSRDAIAMAHLKLRPGSSVEAWRFSVTKMVRTPMGFSPSGRRPSAEMMPAASRRYICRVSHRWCNARRAAPRLCGRSHGGQTHPPPDGKARAGKSGRRRRR